MKPHETIADFYKRYPSVSPTNTGIPEKVFGHFNVNRRDSCNRYAPYNRRDYYKISLIKGEGLLYYADKAIRIQEPTLAFFNPKVPYAWEAISAEQQGYFCLFTQEFLQPLSHDSITESPLFQTGTQPAYILQPDQQIFIDAIFERMLLERDSDYHHKYDLLRSYVNLLIHEAIKMRPAQAVNNSNAAARITSLFVELLERQFPVDSIEHTLKLKTANDYAERLAVHPNHLNRAVKEVTGKTTTDHIAERITREAVALLQHTDWSVAEIGYCLGFEYPAYFNNFFKKQTNVTPLTLRKAV